MDSNKHENGREIISENKQTLQQNEYDLIELTENLLIDARNNFLEKNTIIMPIAELSTLGAAVSSLIPGLRTVTQATTVNTSGLFQLANAAVGDTLKVARNGNFWGALKTADGASKFAQFKPVAPLTATSKVSISMNPATLMMAVALFAINQKLKPIAETGKQIISFLETEKESEIEADVETLLNIIMKYKYNWDNEQYIYGNHKMVLDIQRTARKNMTTYQKRVTDLLSAKQLLFAQSQVDSILKDLKKEFKYYRLSLYIFSMASLLEIMLNGNFKEEYIISVKSEIEKMSINYREIYGQSSIYLEKLNSSSLESNALKGFSTASKAVGKFIGNIPIVKEGQVDEILQNSGDKLRSNSVKTEKSVIGSFAEISNPETAVFIEKMNDMIQIYNHTQQIYFDKSNIYIVVE